MENNPYAAPLADGMRRQILRPPRRPLSRPEIAGRLALVGFIGGGFLGSVGYILLILLFELLLTPPLKSPPNYGQFGMVVIGVAGYLSILGAALFVVPRLTRLGYVPIHLLGLASIWFIDRAFFAGVEWTEAPLAAKWDPAR